MLFDLLMLLLLPIVKNSQLSRGCVYSLDWTRELSGPKRRSRLLEMELLRARADVNMLSTLIWLGPFVRQERHHNVPAEPVHHGQQVRGGTSTI